MDILSKSVTKEVNGVRCLCYVCRDGTKIPVANLNLLKREGIPEYCMTVLCKASSEQLSTNTKRKQAIQEYAYKKISVPNNSVAHYAGADGQGYFSAIRMSSAVLNRNATQIIRGPENAKTFTFPRTAKKASSHSFYKIRSLKHVMLNKQIEVLDGFCFSGCLIKKLELPSSLSQIGENVFDPCTTVYIPDQFDVPPRRLFSKSGVVNVVVPRSVTQIQNQLFDGCATLTDVHFAHGSQLQKVGASAFRKSGVRFCNLPLTVTEIGTMAFFMCKELESLTLGSSLKKLGDMCFCGSARLKIKFQQRSSRSIKKSAITMISVKEMYLADSLEIVEPGWFQKSSLEKVVFPSHVRSVSDFAFSGCTKLKEVDMSRSTFLQKIGREAFRATALTKFIAPPRLLVIGPNAFKECKSLTAVSLNNGLKSIERGAFSQTKIVQIIIPRTVTLLGEYAFYMCQPLLEVSIQCPISEIPRWCFAGSALRSIDIPPSVKCIRECAFQGCFNLRSLFLPEEGNLERVGDLAFQNTRLDAKVLHAGIDIAENAFEKLEVTVSNKNCIVM